MVNTSVMVQAGISVRMAPRKMVRILRPTAPTAHSVQAMACVRLVSVKLEPVVVTQMARPSKFVTTARAGSRTRHVTISNTVMPDTVKLASVHQVPSDAPVTKSKHVAQTVQDGRSHKPVAPHSTAMHPPHSANPVTVKLANSNVTARPSNVVTPTACAGTHSAHVEMAPTVMQMVLAPPVPVHQVPSDATATTSKHVTAVVISGHRAKPAQAATTVITPKTIVQSVCVHPEPSVVTVTKNKSVTAVAESGIPSRPAPAVASA